jgi:enoyl-CoA hydratase/carnithine racemase
MAEWIIDDLDATELWTINGEARWNPMSRAMLKGLAASIQRADKKRVLRCVILTGAGDKSFCAGADLKERVGMSDDDVRTFLGELRGVLRSIEKSPKVFVAALNGVALGGGCELALACDIRIAASHAELGLPEVSLGVIPGGGGTQRLTRAVGVARAKDLILTGRRVGAGEAAYMGLVSLVVRPDALRSEAIALAARIAANAPVSLRQAKHAIDGGVDLSFEEGLTHELRMYEACLSTRDRREALKAFAEKRKPEFTGE